MWLPPLRAREHEPRVPSERPIPSAAYRRYS
jgi:hypothetical protein